MKVFEVVTENYPDNSTEITTTVTYVTSQEDTLKSVSDRFTSHCEQFEESLKCVKEVLVIAEHILPSPTQETTV